MSTLYELTDEYRQLLEMLEDPDEDPEVIRDTMEGISGELEDKALYGMTAFDFDPYTSYMSAEEMNSFSDSIN